MAERSSPVPHCDYEDMNWMDNRPVLHTVCGIVRITRWHQLGLQLEVDSQRLEEIRMDTTRIEEKRTEMFKLWLDTQPTATHRQLLTALRLKSVGEDTVAEEYRKRVKLNYPIKEKQGMINLYGAGITDENKDYVEL